MTRTIREGHTKENDLALEQWTIMKKLKRHGFVNVYYCKEHKLKKPFYITITLIENLYKPNCEGYK